MAREPRDQQDQQLEDHLRNIAADYDSRTNDGERRSPCLQELMEIASYLRRRGISADVLRPLEATQTESGQTRRNVARADGQHPRAHGELAPCDVRGARRIDNSATREDALVRSCGRFKSSAAPMIYTNRPMASSTALS